MTTKQLPWWREPTRAQWAAFMAAWVGWVLDAFDFTIYILVGVHIAKEFGVSPTAVAGSITLTLLVRMLGGWVAGWMADRWGRKLPLMLSLFWFAIFDAAIFFAPTFTVVLVLRTLFGFGMGAEWTAGTALAMESFPAKTRKIASGLLQAGWPVGFLLAALVAHFVVPAYGWRAMFLIAALPAILVIPIRMFVPNELPPTEATVGPAPGKTSMRDLWVPSVRKMLVLGTFVMALGFIVYYGLSANYIQMLMTDHAITFETAMLHMVVFNVGMLVGVVIVGIVADRFGVIIALVTPAILMVPALALYCGLIAGPGLWIGAFLGGALGAGYSGVTPVLTTSLFPAHVRARAIGLVYHAGALIAAFTPVVIPELSASTGLTLSGAVAVVVGIGLVLMVGAILVLRNHITMPAAVELPAISTRSDGGDDDHDDDADADSADLDGTPTPGVAASAVSQLAAQASQDRAVARAAARRAITSN